MNFTQEQQEAIYEEGKNIIVSAGAGSGKTAVLTERVKQKLLKGIHINELLILTFTKEAAQEMKARIRKAILNTPSLKEEANLIDGAYITTFDSFSLSIVKKYHTNLNITSQVEITEEGVITLKKKEILDTIMEENYTSPKQDFLKLIKDFCLKDDEELKQSILNIYQKIELKENKKEFIKNELLKYYDNSIIEERIEEFVNILKEKQEKLKNQLIELEEYFDGDFIEKVRNNFKILENAKTYEDFVEGIQYKSIVVPRGSEEDAKKKKQALFETAKEIKELCIYESTNEMKEEILSTKENAFVIVKILLELDNRLEKYKRENEIFNFTDIAHLAIQVVEENEEIRDELKQSFKEILIDEYQDTSDTQEKFISLIENHNVYMVGDVKQSIYRFRNANPYIFKSKYDSYQDGRNGMKIDLLKNFRSRREVLQNINDIFDFIMSDEIGGASYKESHRMVFGNTSYEEEGQTKENNNLDIITYNKEELGRISENEQEAFIIGNDIKEKIKEKYQVFDKDLKVLRNIEYKDFVILLDKSKYFDLYKKIFEYLEIPLNILKEESLKKEDDVLLLKNLLKFLIGIKEHQETIEWKKSFFSIARSYLFQLKDEELYEIMKNNTIKETDIYKTGEEIVKEMDKVPLSTFLMKVLDTYKYEEKLLTIPNTKSFRIREEYFYNLCKNYEKRGNNIYEFIEYLDQIFEEGIDLKFNIKSSSTNSVKIMTIHKSKGLEFPICYFASFSSRFNLSELKEKILFDNKYGLILPYVKEYYKDTILKTLLKKNTKKEEISEKIRLFYVALTRAKEKMIMVLREGEEEEEEISESVKENYNSFLSIMDSIYSSLYPYIKKSNVKGTKDYLYQKEKEEESKKQENTLVVEELEIKQEEIEETHYSKSSLSLPNKEEVEKMKFGTKVHEILELMDFHSYDLSKYKINNRMKEKIDAFLNSSFMKKNLDGNIEKEVEFFYEEENSISHGIIDLLIEKEEEIVIVDYKLKNIDDIEYEKQLKGYQKAVESFTKKKVKCYLYSILEEEIKEVV